MLKLKLPYFGHLMQRATWKRPWCWERLKAGGEVRDRVWDGWMASPTQWTRVWTNSRRRWRTGLPAAVHGVSKNWTWLSDWTTINWEWFKELTSLFTLQNKEMPEGNWTGKGYGGTSSTGAIPETLPIFVWKGDLKHKLRYKIWISRHVLSGWDCEKKLIGLRKQKVKLSLTLQSKGLSRVLQNQNLQNQNFLIGTFLFS